MSRPRRKPTTAQNRTAEPGDAPPTSDKEERDRRIWQLDLSGYSSREIGLKVGLSKTVVCEILNRLRATESPAWSTEEIRAVEHARLLRLLRALEPGVEAHDVPSIKEVRQISESIRVLYGANGPVEVNVTETTQADLAMRDMLNEARARAAAERAKAAGDVGS